MIRIVRKKTGVRLAEERCAAPISLGKDYLVKEHNFRVGGCSGLTFSNKLIET